MISADSWFDAAIDRGYTFLTGVPCSYLTPFINAAISGERTQYVGAASEGEAVAIGCGAWLGGKKSVVMCQNSGFGNTVNPLTSLSWIFGIPHLLVTTWRGQPGVKDEPQHELMGRNMLKILESVDLPFEIFPKEEADIAASLERAEAFMQEHRRPFGFLMEKGTVAPSPLNPRPLDRGEFPTENYFDLRKHGPRDLNRRSAIALVREHLGDQSAYLGTTGKLGRELFFLGDGDNQFYNVGSMGCVSAIGLGVAVTQPKRQVVALDGDGSLLMKLGALATIGHYAPRNFIHVVIDNEVHESTGAQATVSSTVDFARIALGAGYRHAYSIDDQAGLQQALAHMKNLQGPILLHQKVHVATDPKLGRPTIHPKDVALRFRNWLT